MILKHSSCIFLLWLSSSLISCNSNNQAAVSAESPTARASATQSDKDKTLNKLDITPSATYLWKVGQTEINALVYYKEGQSQSDLLLVNLHDDENSSVDAAKAYVSASNGIFVELKHSGQRLINFKLSDKSYTFDPNRIFTKLGITKTLKKYGNTSLAAESEVDGFAQKILAIIAGKKTVIAVHNNTNDEYSILSYKAGGEYQSDASDIFINPGNDVDDFFYLTEASDFEFLKSKGLNVVLQNNRSVTDDGSLSVYCGQKNIKYINIEAEHGHKDGQLSMLNVLSGIINK